MHTEHEAEAEPRAESLVAYVRRRLNESNAKRGGEGWNAVAQATGVPYFTISKIASGLTENPRANTLQPLLDHFGHPGVEQPRRAA